MELNYYMDHYQLVVVIVNMVVYIINDLFHTICCQLFQNAVFGDRDIRPVFALKDNRASVQHFDGMPFALVNMSSVYALARIDYAAHKRHAVAAIYDHLDTPTQHNVSL